MAPLRFLLCLAFVFIPASAIFKGPPSKLLQDANGATCVYSIFVRTGSILKAGTDSNISVELFDLYGNSLKIDNLESWGGVMPIGWNYFERGNLDIFTGRGYCLDSAPCKAILSSDGSGDHHGWYVNYAEVTITGPHLGCSQTLFTIEQWLARDVYPYELIAARDKCSQSLSIK